MLPSPSLSLLAASLPLLGSVAATPVDFTWWPDFDFADWWARQQFSCPLWRGELPNGAETGTCNNAWTRSYVKGSTTARYYQKPGTWQSDARYSEISNGVAAAIEKGVNLFGAFADGPLTINVGLHSGHLGDRVQTDLDNGIKNPCYVLVSYPPSWRPVPLVAIQKDVIRNMYYCLEQFYHPTLTTMRNGDGSEWWRRGVARYFDGLAYPFTEAIATDGLYPEEYSYGRNLYQNDEASAIFFHFADSLGGWSPADVHNWMRNHAVTATYETERAALSADAALVAIFHKFELAFVDEATKYPGGQKIVNRLGTLPPREFDVVDLAPGASYSKRFSVDSWKGTRMSFPIRAGQTMRVSATLADGVEWSIRKQGTTAWNSGARDRTFNAVAGASNTKYEVVVSSTRNAAGGFLGDINMVRI